MNKLPSNMEQNVVACASSSREQAMEVSSVIENLAQNLFSKVKENRREWKNMQLTNMIKREAKVAKQYIVVSKVLD